MEVINYTNSDFALTISCQKIDEVYNKAYKKIENIEIATHYKCSDLVAVFEIWHPRNRTRMPFENGAPAHPVFFENTLYKYEITFTTPVTGVGIYSPLKEIAEKFYTNKKALAHTVIGSINYKNDVGFGEFVLIYEKDSQPKNWAFEFEVFPSKLDLKRDHRILVEELEETFSNIALDILTKTWINYSHKKGLGSNISWWSIFESVFQELIQSISFILNKPHSRLQDNREYRRIDHIKRFPPSMEREWIKYRENPGHLYIVDTKLLSHDTNENRFLKHVAVYCWQKFSKLSDFVITDKKKRISELEIDRLTELKNKLKKIKSHSFFDTIGSFSGLPQESAVLQKKSGYSTVYRDWLFLRRILQLFEGIHKIHLKDIAELYQFWCFLKVKTLIELLINKKSPGEDLLVSEIDNFLFSLRRGESSRIEFHADHGDIIELYHDLSYDKPSQDGSGSQVYTEIQRPDIILRISKPSAHNWHVFTYLFDAKYRLNHDREGIDTPPVDAINQMHRYRDAIYHRDSAGMIVKEVIGGYVLFPGADTLEVIKQSDYYRSIYTINIGGFPLLPGNTNGSEELLKKHLQDLIFSEAHSLYEKVIPHKGLQYQDADPMVLCIFPSLPGQSESFKPDGSSIYHVPVLNSDGTPFSITLHGEIKYLAVSRDGLLYYSSVINLNIVQKEGEIYYAFHLAGHKHLAKGFPTSPEGNPDFLYTPLSKI